MFRQTDRQKELDKKTEAVKDIPRDDECVLILASDSWPLLKTCVEE